MSLLIISVFNDLDDYFNNTNNIKTGKDKLAGKLDFITKLICCKFDMIFVAKKSYWCFTNIMGWCSTELDCQFEIYWEERTFCKSCNNYLVNLKINVQ